MTIAGEGGSGAPVASAQRAGDAERQQPDQRGSAPEVLPILAVERVAVTERILGGGIPLGAAGAASSLTTPAHDVAVAREAEAMAEQPAAQHPDRGYSWPTRAEGGR